jgi:hypothetical protein
MKRWLLLLAVAGVVVVGLLARRNQAPGTRIVSKTENLPPPPAPPAIPVSTVPSIDVRAEVVRLLERLVQTIKDSDLEGESRIQSELQAFGISAVEPMRIDLLGNPELSHRDYRFQQSVVRTLTGLASPETGLELLKTWSEIDQAKYAMSIRPALFILGQYAPVVARQPAPELAKRILEEFSNAKTREIRLSLVELMGLLLMRFPSLRDDLLRIMLEDKDTEVRAGAVAALSAQDPGAVLPSILKRLETLLETAGDSRTMNPTKELWTLVDFLVAALPVDQVLDRLKELSEKAVGVHSVNHLSSLGFALGGKWGEAGDPGLEIMLSRAGAEKSRNMQLIYLGVLAGVTLKKNTDPRTTDLALAYYEGSGDEWVRSHALSMVTALNRDEKTVLGLIDKAITGGGRLASTGGMQLAFYAYVKSPGSVTALDMIRRHVTTGDLETRLAVLKNLCVSSTPMPASVREIVKALSESDPNPKIRERATNVLNWTGGPPPR